MTTDLRAALREAADHLNDIAPGADIAVRLRTLADAPLTAVELLPLVDATHEVRWVDADGDEWRAFAIGGGRPIGFAFKRKSGHWYDGNPCDLTSPARLVEVTP